MLMRREQVRAYLTPLAVVLLGAFLCAGAFFTVCDVISWLT